MAGYSKYTRLNTPGAAHFLTFSCYKKQKFLNYDRSRMYFAHALIQTGIKYEFDIWAYVIMPEHVHILIWPRSEVYSISNILKAIKQSVSRKIINYLGDKNSSVLKYMETGLEHPKYRFWQDGGGFDRLVNDHDKLAEIVTYIHQNPVRRGLVKDAVDWHWSSEKDWMCLGQGAIEINLDHFPST